MRLAPLLPHLLQVAGPLVLLAGTESCLPRGLAAVLLFFALFTLAHDAMHGALGLPRRLNEVLLALAGASIGLSGHVARQLHMVHHARPFSAEDLEGRSISWPLCRALLEGPRNYLALPWLGWARVPARLRPVQLLEWAAVLLLFTLALGHPAPRSYLAVVLAAQFTIPLWGARLPHRPPRLLWRLAHRLLWTRSPLVLGLVFHELHHAHPRIASYSLQQLGR